MATLRLFAQAREAAGVGQDDLPDGEVAELLEVARQRYGSEFAAVLATSKVWLNGQPARDSDTVAAADELAVLPPVSGG